VVRPEKLRATLVEEPAPANLPSVEGLVESSIYLGTATQMVVRLSDGVGMTVLVPNADEAERQRLPGAGARVRLSWATDHMHVVRESESNSDQPVTAGAGDGEGDAS
jgi:ABC-type Fe3+/spermidine/putrescine transport system ATPase subunit